MALAICPGDWARELYTRGKSTTEITIIAKLTFEKEFSNKAKKRLRPFERKEGNYFMKTHESTQYFFILSYVICLLVGYMGQQTDGQWTDSIRSLSLFHLRYWTQKLLSSPCF